MSVKITDTHYLSAIFHTRLAFCSFTMPEPHIGNKEKEMQHCKLTYCIKKPTLPPRGRWCNYKVMKVRMDEPGNV